MTEAAELESCEVACWRGYVSSEFYAVSHLDGAVIVRSKSFRWRRETPPPDRPATRAAYDDLAAKLVALGWKAAGRAGDGPWYATCFERPLTGTRRTFEPGPQPRRTAAVEMREDAAQPGPSERDVVALPREVAIPREVALPATAGDDAAQSPAAVTEPEVVPPAAPAEPNVPARKTGRSRRRWQLVVVAALLIAAAVVAWIVTGHPTSARSNHPSVAHPPKPSSATPRKPAAKTVPRKHQSRAGTRLSVSSGDRGSWLEVRRDSATGAVLYSGVLSGGQTLHLGGKQLWVRFGAASNLGILVNGRQVSLAGTLQGLFTPNGFRPG